MKIMLEVMIPLINGNKITGDNFMLCYRASISNADCSPVIESVETIKSYLGINERSFIVTRITGSD